MVLHRTAQAQLNNWRDMPTEPLVDLYAAGLRVIHLRVDYSPAGEVTKDYIKRIKDAGPNMKILATINPDSMNTNDFPFIDGSDPIAVADWVVKEKRRIGAYGVDVNAEDVIENLDNTGKEWSKKFLTRLRLVCPGTALVLNTFTGAGYINFSLWETANARLHIQQHDAGEPMARSTQSLLDFAKMYGWKNLAKVKPQIGIFDRPDGSRLNPADFLTSADLSNTVGWCGYYIEDTLDWMTEYKQFIRDSINTGIAEL